MWAMVQSVSFGARMSLLQSDLILYSQDNVWKVNFPLWTLGSLCLE